MKKQTTLNVVLATGCAAILFAAIIFIFLKQPAYSAGNEQSNVPYAEPYERDSCGFLVRFRDGNSVFLNFDFYESRTSVLFLPSNADADTVSSYGYEVYKTIDTDYSFLGSLADRLGGLELEADGKPYKYTGVQLKERLATTTDRTLRRQLAAELLGRFYSRGLTKEDLVFVIENTETTLNFPDAYNLSAMISAVCKNINFIN